MYSCDPSCLAPPQSDPNGPTWHDTTGSWVPEIFASTGHERASKFSSGQFGLTSSLTGPVYTQGNSRNQYGPQFWSVLLCGPAWPSCMKPGVAATKAGLQNRGSTGPIRAASFFQRSLFKWRLQIFWLGCLGTRCRVK